MRYALVAWPAHSLLIGLSAYFIFKSIDHAVYTFYPVTRNVLFLIEPLLVCHSRLAGAFFLGQCSEY